MRMKEAALVPLVNNDLVWFGHISRKKRNLGKTPFQKTKCHLDRKAVLPETTANMKSYRYMHVYIFYILYSPFQPWTIQMLNNALELPFLGS